MLGGGSKVRQTSESDTTQSKPTICDNKKCDAVESECRQTAPKLAKIEKLKFKHTHIHDKETTALQNNLQVIIQNSQQYGFAQQLVKQIFESIFKFEFDKEQFFKIPTKNQRKFVYFICLAYFQQYGSQLQLVDKLFKFVMQQFTQSSEDKKQQDETETHKKFVEQFLVEKYLTNFKYQIPEQIINDKITFDTLLQILDADTFTVKLEKVDISLKLCNFIGMELKRKKSNSLIVFYLIASLRDFCRISANSVINAIFEDFFHIDSSDITDNLSFDKMISIYSLSAAKLNFSNKQQQITYFNGMKQIFSLAYKNNSFKSIIEPLNQLDKQCGLNANFKIPESGNDIVKEWYLRCMGGNEAPRKPNATLLQGIDVQNLNRVVNDELGPNDNEFANADPNIREDDPIMDNGGVNFSFSDDDVFNEPPREK